MAIRTRLERVEKQVERLSCPRCNWPGKDSRDQEQVETLRFATIEELRTLQQITDAIAKRRAGEKEVSTPKTPPLTTA
jgi:hypothetical protein